MKNTESGQKIVIAERDNIAAVIENGKVSEFFINRGEILLGDVYLAQVENRVDKLEEDMPLLQIDCKEIQALVRKKGIEALGGYRSIAYNDNSLRGKKNSC